ADISVRRSGNTLGVSLLGSVERPQAVIDRFLVPVQPLAGNRQVIERHGLVVQTSLLCRQLQGSSKEALRSLILVFIQGAGAFDQLDSDGKVAVFDGSPC